MDWIDALPFCPLCGEPAELKYNLVADEEICECCNEDVEAGRMKFIVRVDTKPGVIPSMGAMIEVEAPNQRAAEAQAKQNLAAAACVLVSKVRIRKTEIVWEAV